VATVGIPVAMVATTTATATTRRVEAAVGTKHKHRERTDVLLAVDLQKDEREMVSETDPG